MSTHVTDVRKPITYAEIDAEIDAGCPARGEWERVRNEYLTVGAAAD